MRSRGGYQRLLAPKSTHIQNRALEWENVLFLAPLLKGLNETLGLWIAGYQISLLNM